MVSTVGLLGYEVYRANVLGFPQPHPLGVGGGFSWPQFLREQPAAPGNCEGFVSLASSCSRLSRFAKILGRGVHWIRWRRLLQLFLVFVFSLLVGFPNNAAVGPFVLLHYDMPPILDRFSDTFHGSGRFIWLAYYLVMAEILV